jgi:hypothetical protein
VPVFAQLCPAAWHLATAFGLPWFPLMQALTLMLQSVALTCAAEPPMTAKASRVRSNILFMYQSSFPIGRDIVNLVQHLGDRFVAGNHLDPLFRHIITRHAFDPANPPRIAAIDRSVLPVGEGRLREHAGLHRHIVFDDYHFSANGIV